MLKRNKEKGITLIALVVTIIVLLILAAVSIAMLTGENGILTNAQKAKNETRGATVEEARDIWKATKETDKLANSTTAQTLEELINDLVQQKQLTENEKDIILGNDTKGIEAKYEITIGSRNIDFKSEKQQAWFTINGIDCYVDFNKDYYETASERVLLERWLNEHLLGFNGSYLAPGVFDYYIGDKMVFINDELGNTMSAYNFSIKRGADISIYWEDNKLVEDIDKLIINN